MCRVGQDLYVFGKPKAPLAYNLNTSGKPMGTTGIQLNILVRPTLGKRRELCGVMQTLAASRTERAALTCSAAGWVGPPAGCWPPGACLGPRSEQRCCCSVEGGGAWRLREGAQVLAGGLNASAHMCTLPRLHGPLKPSEDPLPSTLCIAQGRTRPVHLVVACCAAHRAGARTWPFRPPACTARCPRQAPCPGSCACHWPSAQPTACQCRS